MTILGERPFSSSSASIEGSDIYGHTYVRTFVVGLFLRAYVCKDLRTYVRTYVLTYARIRTYVRTKLRTYVPAYVLTYIRT